MTTPMQELIDKLTDFSTELKEKYDGDPVVVRGVYIAINEAKQMLEKEKQAIIDAYIHPYDIGGNSFELGEVLDSAEQYYNKTYKQ